MYEDKIIYHIQGFLESSVEVIWAVINVNMQWPLSEHPHMHNKWDGLYGSATLSLTAGVHAIIVRKDLTWS